MITTRPEVEPAGLYTQSQSARILQVDRHTISRYEKGSIMKFKIRKADGRKVTTGLEILKCWRGTII